MEPVTVSIEDATKLTGLGRDVLYQLMRIGKLKFNQVGTRRLIVFSSLKECAAEQPTTTEELNAGRKAGEAA